MDQVRRVYHRALGTPLEGIETLWHQYDAYENALNRVTAKKMLSDKSSAYMAARQAAKELATILGEGGLGDGSGSGGGGNLLPPSSLSSEWALPPPADASLAAAIYGHWLRWIRWERANPLGLVEGSPALNQRIQYAYKVSLGVSLRHYPEMWFDYARWLLLASTVTASTSGTVPGTGQAGKRSALAEEAEITLRTAVQVLPHDLLVNFALADLLESAAATATIIAAATTTTAAPTTTTIPSVTTAAGGEENGGATKVTETRPVSGRETKGTASDASPASASPALEVYAALVETLSAQVTASAPTPPDQSLVDNLTLALIQQMNCARRVEGISAARAIFTRARKLPHISYQLFVASAQMELHCKRDATVAGRIYELGMSRFGHCPPYVLAYLEHLLGQQDEANARALFERALVSLAPGEALDLWKTYLDHHFRYGEQATVSLLLERFRAAYGDHPISADLSVFARQYGYEEGGLALATDRTWLILSGTGSSTGSEAGLRRRLLASMPVPFSVPDKVWELQQQLPLLNTYAGPLLNVDGMVRLLQVVRLVPDAPQAVAPPRRRDQSGATRRSASGGVKKASSSSTAASARRHRDRHRLDAGDDGGASSVAAMEEQRNDDLFAQRYGNKQ